MTSNIEKGQLWSDRKTQQLTLAYSARRMPNQLFTSLATEEFGTTNKQPIAQVTYALMCRLWIPHTSTIIGMLGVGLSKSNFEEISKWVARELPTAASGDVQDSFRILERRFRQAVDQFPED